MAMVLELQDDLAARDRLRALISRIRDADSELQTNTTAAAYLRGKKVRNGASEWLKRFRRATGHMEYSIELQTFVDTAELVNHQLNRTLAQHRSQYLAGVLPTDMPIAAAVRDEPWTDPVVGG